MKNILKPQTKKASHKGITNVPTFKKSKTTVRMTLPKQITIEENTIKKSKFDKLQAKNDKKKNATNKLKAENVKGKENLDFKALILDIEKSEKASANINKKDIKPFQKVEKTLKSTKNCFPSEYVTAEIASKAVKALQQLAVQQKNKYKIFEDESNVFAQIMCVKIQSKKTTVKINLPHSTAASTGEICLITTDLKKGRKHDHEPSIDHWEEELRKAGVTEVKTIMPMRQLRVEYDQFELKRRLLTQHDYILVDSRVHGHVCHILGKIFFNKHNMLIPVRLHEVADIKNNIQRALNTTLLHLSEGATSTVTIGHTGMSTKQLKENLLGLVKQLAQKFPGGEQNIRSLSIKLPLSLALPVYVTLRSKKSIHPPKIRTELPKKHLDVEGELSTIPGSIIKISPEGTVTVKRNTDDFISDIEDEELSEDEEEKTKPKNKKQKIAAKPSQEESDSDAGSGSELEDNLQDVGSDDEGASDSNDDTFNDADENESLEDSDSN